MKSVLQFLGWSLAAIAGPIVPWFQPLFNVNLIGEYLQNKFHFNSIASLFSFIAFPFIYGIYRKSKPANLKRHVFRYWLPLFLLCFLLCLTAVLTVGVTWDPGGNWTIVVWIAWILVYLVMFITLAGILCLMSLFIKGTDGGSSAKPPASNAASESPD